MPTADIVVVGSYNKDVTLSVARLPAPGETLLALSRSECPGGKGCNQAIQAARCGAATAMIAAVGEDAAGIAASKGSYHWDKRHRKYVQLQPGEAVRAGKRVKAAEDFIEVCATRSSFSGTAYQIRLPDGTITEAAPFFRAKLRDYDDAHK